MAGIKAQHTSLVVTAASFDSRTGTGTNLGCAPSCLDRLQSPPLLSVTSRGGKPVKERTRAKAVLPLSFCAAGAREAEKKPATELAELFVKRHRILLCGVLALLCLLSGSSAWGQVITEFSAGITAGAQPYGITAGPDGNLWFTELVGNRIGRITPLGVVTEFSAGITAGAGLAGITAGPDGNLWFTEADGNRIGRITPLGVVTEFSAGITAGAQPYGITAGPDGNLWFTELAGNRIGRITPAGVVTEFSAGITAGAQPYGITAGPDGNLWFTHAVGIGRITPLGVVTEFPAGPSNSITASPDGNLWFTELRGHFSNDTRIGRITPLGVVTVFSAGFSLLATPLGITPGPDGNLWFADFQGFNGNQIGRITPLGVVTEFSAGISAGAFPVGITAGPDGNLWFTERYGNRIGRITTVAGPPPISLSSSPNPSFVVRTPVTFTATVTPPPGGATLTGIVIFADGATVIGSGAVNAGGVATFVTSALTIGLHTITAAYGGDAAYQFSSTAQLVQVISDNPACVSNSATNADLVEQYYAAILGRRSEPGGKAFWRSEADRLCSLGADPAQTFVVMANVFFNTPEYLAFNRDDIGFVTDLYKALFNRQRDAGGLRYWLSQLASGMPRNNVMSWFLLSPEFEAMMNSAFPGQMARAETYLVLNLYGGLFRRLAESGGYTYWTGQFRAAQCNASPAAAVQAAIDSVSSQFVASAEYAARATTNSQYVVDMYYALLQRGAEPGAIDYWVGQLDGGFLSRFEVRQQFLTSPEMTAQSAAIAAQGCLH